MGLPGGRGGGGGEVLPVERMLISMATPLRCSGACSACPNNNTECGGGDIMVTGFSC